MLRSIITVPLAIHQNKLIAEIELHQPTVSMMTEALKHRVVSECRRSGVSADEADRLFKKRVYVHLCLISLNINEKVMNAIYATWQ